MTSKLDSNADSLSPSVRRGGVRARRATPADYTLAGRESHEKAARASAG
jgi:hypothetical protein